MAEIDDDLADTAAFTEAYGVPPEASANCVVVAARRAGQTTLAACLVLATTRADVNGLVRRHLGARKASFAPQDVAVAETGMAYGGITPVGLPAAWPVLVDAAVAAADLVVIGSGTRGSKLAVPGACSPALPARRGARRPRPAAAAGAAAAPRRRRPARAGTRRQRRRLGRAAARPGRRRPALPGGPAAALGQRLTAQSWPGSAVVPGARRVGPRARALLRAQQVADLGQQLHLGRRDRAGLLAAPAPLHDRLHRQHDDEVDDRRRQHEGDHRVEERAPGEHLAVDRERAAVARRRRSGRSAARGTSR